MQHARSVGMACLVTCAANPNRREIGLVAHAQCLLRMAVTFCCLASHCQLGGLSEDSGKVCDGVIGNMVGVRGGTMECVYGSTHRGCARGVTMVNK